ncbi:hypothetical protein BDD43_3701 [Mucilaginibacter gracilis]|uniref:Uncharacterized protein n=1 Tax=Mucilaginibacter gracilis TaxID=423350 RepID=A0A495J476_9SPHI|nr:hypothetical protein [Mucilaginibacter gracilis]RKR83491.1 hypothetical protein BDD43_3701 [Mucilaginibacter gracilis]
MKSKQYWKIKCTEHLKTLFECKVSVNHLSEKRLKEFMQTLIAKYILTPQEILDEHKSIPFKKKTQYVHITRTNEKLSGKTTINFMADSAGISVIAYLIEEFE